MNDRRPPLGGAAFDDEESTDATSPAQAGDGRLDVTPRTGAHSSAAGRSNTKRMMAIGGVVVLLGALGVVLFNGLNDATLFYFNVDEALDQRGELGDDRFRMQGNVIDGSITETADGVEFDIAYGDAQTPVQHRGAPPELFSPDIPVIIEGSFGESAFESDEILIRHDNTYTEEHEDRLRDATDDAESRTETAG